MQVPEVREHPLQEGEEMNQGMKDKIRHEEEMGFGYGLRRKGL
jgi:hypothetical protein